MIVAARFPLRNDPANNQLKRPSVQERICFSHYTADPEDLSLECHHIIVLKWFSAQPNVALLQRPDLL